MLFRLAGAILRGAAALHQRHVISPAGLRTALSMARSVERGRRAGRARHGSAAGIHRNNGRRQ
ncbi:hypothetical protein [Bradyrhizobium sp. USDA 4451]